MKAHRRPPEHIPAICVLLQNTHTHTHRLSPAPPFSTSIVLTHFHCRLRAWSRCVGSPVSCLSWSTG